MQQTMQAAFIKAPWQFEIREVPVPSVQENWVLLKVDACSICGTDLHFARGWAQDWQGFGHEVAGTVVELGAGVHTVQIGDKVTLESGSFCGNCSDCRNGRVDLCRNVAHFGENFTQGFAEYMLAPKESLVPFHRISPEVASICEPLGVALDLTITSDIALGNEVVVVGLGPIGLMTIPLLKMRGASKIYAVDISGGKRFEVAKHYGADEVINVRQTPWETLPFKGKINRALVTAPPRSILEVMPMMSYGGIIGFIGIELGDGATISFNANDFHFKKLQLRASHASPALYLPTCVKLLEQGLFDGEAIISHVMPLEKIAEAMFMLRDDRENVLKITIKP